MKDMNRVFLLGRLGNIPELTIGKSGKPYSRLSVATHRQWMNAEDQREDRTDWHSVFVFGNLAERCCTYLEKGAMVFVEGELSYWKGSDREFKNAIHASEVKFLSGTPSKTFSEAEIPTSGRSQREAIDNSPRPRNHNAVAHPA